jgi:hypothetical protein
MTHNSTVNVFNVGAIRDGTHGLERERQSPYYIYEILNNIA